MQLGVCKSLKLLLAIGRYGRGRTIRTWNISSDAALGEGGSSRRRRCCAEAMLDWELVVHEKRIKAVARVFGRSLLLHR